MALLAVWAAYEHLLMPALRWLVTHPANQVIDDISSRLRIGIRPFQRTRRQALVQRLATDPKVQQAAEHYAQRVAWAYLIIAVRGDHQAAAGSESAAQKAEQVESGFVGPVHVFVHEYQGARRLSELREYRAEHLAAWRRLANQRLRAGAEATAPRTLHAGEVGGGAARGEIRAGARASGGCIAARADFRRPDPIDDAGGRP